MKLGTQVQLLDGRIGTVVFNGLCGVGIKWGRHDPPAEEFRGTSGDLTSNNPKPTDWDWYPDAYLRDEFPSADAECVGTEFVVLREGYDI